MNFFKTTTFLLFTLFTLSFTSVAVHAETAVAAPSAKSAEIVAHLEKALVEIKKSDFSAAQVHLKAARFASDALVGESDAAKKAHAVLIQGQIQAKKGDVAKATEIVNQAIELFKAL